MKKTLFIVLVIALLGVLGVAVFGIYRMQYVAVQRDAARKAAASITTTTTTVPQMSTTTTTFHQGTTTTFQIGTTTTTLPVTGGDSTTTTTTAANSPLDCKAVGKDLLSYWKEVTVEDIDAFIAKIPEVRKYIIDCGDKEPYTVIELRRWVEVRLGI